MKGKWYLVLKLENGSKLDVATENNFYYALKDGVRLVYLPLLGVDGEDDAIAKANKLWLGLIMIEPKAITFKHTVIYELPLF